MAATAAAGADANLGKGHVQVVMDHQNALGRRYGYQCERAESASPLAFIKVCGLTRMTC